MNRHVCALFTNGQNRMVVAPRFIRQHEEFVKELSAPEGLPFRYRYSSPTQNNDAPKTIVSIVAKGTLSRLQND